MSPETGQAPENLSLRERLALKAGTTADKIPAVNPMYEQGFGNGGARGGLTQPSIQGTIGQKRRKVEESSDEEEEFKGARARDPP